MTNFRIPLSSGCCFWLFVIVPFFMPCQLISTDAGAIHSDSGFDRRYVRKSWLIVVLFHLFEKRFASNWMTGSSTTHFKHILLPLLTLYLKLLKLGLILDLSLFFFIQLSFTLFLLSNSLLLFHIRDGVDTIFQSITLFHSKILRNSSCLFRLYFFLFVKTFSNSWMS